jgi:hypothetical protein
MSYSGLKPITLPTHFLIHCLISGPEDRKTKEVSIVQFRSHFTLKLSVTKFKVKLFSFAAYEFAFEDSYRTSNRIPYVAFSLVYE